MIELENVSKIYGQGDASVLAVNDTTLDLKPGQLNVLMGPSGSGKTTLLMIMGCLLKPTSGSVYLFGEKVSDLNERLLPFIRRKYVGFIFQGFNLFPALTALENVEATLNVKGLYGAKARRMAAALLEKVGLKDRANHLPEDLSGGEKQRVAVARALAGDPSIILADEPTGMLDSKTGRTVVTLLKELAEKENRLVFMVSHDNRILDLADWILWMEDGVIRTKEERRS